MTTLVARRTIRATAARLFDAWTQPSELRRWWGPAGVECVGAEVDLRPGGVFRIANRFPDGRVVWITGVFEAIDRPRRLVYSWKIEGQSAGDERVTVRFDERGDATEVVIEHERITDEMTRRSHEEGWEGCLTGLARYISGSAVDPESDLVAG